MNPINEDDIGELKSLKYKIKSVLEHPRTELYELLGLLFELQAIHKKFISEQKEIPESDEYLELADMQLVIERFIDGLEERMEQDVYS